MSRRYLQSTLRRRDKTNFQASMQKGPLERRKGDENAKDRHPITFRSDEYWHEIITSANEL